VQHHIDIKQLEKWRREYVNQGKIIETEMLTTYLQSPESSVVEGLLA